LQRPSSMWESSLVLVRSTGVPISRHPLSWQNSIAVSKLLLLVSSKKHKTYPKGPGQVVNPRVQGISPCVKRLYHGNTMTTYHLFEFWRMYCYNFVLKVGILKSLTSPSILWTILFVCTRSCKINLNTPFVPAGFYFYHCLETQGIRKLVSILNLACPSNR